MLIPQGTRHLQEGRLEGEPSLYGLKDRSQISISYNMASLSLLYATSHELVFSPIVSWGMALNLLFYILISLPLLRGTGT